MPKPRELSGALVVVVVFYVQATKKLSAQILPSGAGFARASADFELRACYMAQLSVAIYWRAR